MFRNYNKYEICEDGRIWSKVSKKWLKPQTRLDGYQQVNLYDNEGKRHTERLHKVIFCAVNGLWNLPEKMELNHLDEDKTNCAIWNISCCSHQDNCNHGTRNERSAKARINHPDRSKRCAAYKNGELQMVFPSTQEAERQGFKHSAVAACCKNCFNREGNNVYKGYVWKYLDN